MIDKLREALERLVNITKAGFQESRGEEDSATWQKSAIDAVQIAEKALATSYEWRVPDETTPDQIPTWTRSYMDAHRLHSRRPDLFPGEGWSGWRLVECKYRDTSNPKHLTQTVIAKENQGPPPDDWRPI